MKRLFAVLCSVILLLGLFPATALADGNGNMDSGGGGMGQGTSSNKWIPGEDGVRVTVVDADSGAAVSPPLDFSNKSHSGSVLHFGKVNKLQYKAGSGLSLQSGVAYSCIKPATAMPTIVSSTGRSNIAAIKRYFCSEYACKMVAQYAGVDYEAMIAGKYKLLVEPIAYFTHNSQYYCMTATEAGLYDQLSGGALRSTMTSLTHKNLPLSMFLEYSDLGISAWGGSTTGKQSNADIISTLGVGIVWFTEIPKEPEGGIEAPDVEYRTDTDVITAVTLTTNTDLTPDNPATVTFNIMGTSYRVRDIENNTISVNHNLIYRVIDGKAGFHITTPKTARGTRTIPVLFPEVTEQLRALYEVRETLYPGPELVLDGCYGFVFRNRFGSFMSAHNINRAIVRIYTEYNMAEMEQAELEDREPELIPHFSVHNLRHTFCTRLCEMTSDIKFIQQVMGHADFSTTMDIYTHITEENMQNKVKSISGQFKLL